MMENPMELRALTVELGSAAFMLSTIGVMFESGLVDSLREPRTLDELAAAHSTFGRAHLEHVLELGVALGVVGAEGGRFRLAPAVMPATQPPMRAALLGEIRSMLLQPPAFLDAAKRGEPTTGWRYADPAVLQAQGDSSAGLPAMFARMIVPQLGDLATRLARPGARFLDIGVGVGALAIAACRVWPEARVVGLDVYDQPLAVARDNIARAGLGERIELRQVAAEELVDSDGFDLAWLPSFFIQPAVLPRVAKAVHAALRPGGWMIFASFAPTGDTRMCAATRVLADLWGGGTVSAAEAEQLLTGAGFTTVRTLPGPPGAGMVVAQRG